MRRRIEQALQQVSAMPPASILETSSILATTALLKSTDMVSVVPLDVALLYARHGMLDVRPVDMPIAMAKLNILTRKRHSPSPAAAAFLQTLRTSMADDRSGQR
jgi:DNA-binding transcriptional LysR family regulator